MKYAVVTGATKGIGRAIAERFLHEGFFIIGNYASDDNAADRFYKENIDYSGKIALIKSDLSSWCAAREVARQVKRLTEKVDVLVLNSGTTDRSSFDEITEESWRRVMDVNLNAPFFLIRELSNHMSNNTGRIILIGSLLGVYPHAMSISYGVSKAAVHALAGYLAKYFSPRGITVNAVAPGFVDTPWQSEKTPEHRKRIENKIALHRFGTSKEVAALCMHLVENQYINGALLPIDGGYSYQ